MAGIAQHIYPHVGKGVAEIATMTIPINGIIVRAERVNRLEKRLSKTSAIRTKVKPAKKPVPSAKCSKMGFIILQSKSYVTKLLWLLIARQSVLRLPVCLALAL